jgi:DNA-binding GntR family transcriptional regulator
MLDAGRGGPDAMKIEPVAAPAPPKDKGGEAERVYRLIKRRILRGGVRPGEFLAEVELARLCKTSRTPVREACNRLAQENWLTHIRHKGYFVPPISVREIVDAYEYRRLLEGFAGEKAAAVARPEQIASLKQDLRVESDPQAGPEAIVEANHRIHLGIAEIAGNVRVLDQLRHVLEYVDRLDMLSLQKDHEIVTHDGIVHAIGARRPAEARRALEEHIDAARDRMLKLFGG